MQPAAHATNINASNLSATSICTEAGYQAQYPGSVGGSGVSTECEHGVYGDDTPRLVDESTDGAARAFIMSGVTYRTGSCIHLPGRDGPCMVARIDETRRWRPSDAREHFESDFKVGEIVMRLSWFYRAADTNNPRATADAREIFCTHEQDWNRPAAICCACVVRYVPHDDETDLANAIAELRAADDAIREGLRPSAAASYRGAATGVPQLAPCEGNEKEDGTEIVPCTHRHYYFRRWYDPTQRTFSVMSPTGGADDDGATFERSKQGMQRRFALLNLGVEAKLRALLDHVAALRVNKAFRRVAMERRLPLTVKRTDIVGCVLRAFAQMNGPSLFRQTEVKFVGESGVDHGGLTSEMLADFFGALVPMGGGGDLKLGGSDGGHVAEPFRTDRRSPPAAPSLGVTVPQLFDTSGGLSSSYWLPRCGLHHQRVGLLSQLHTVGKILAKCLLELHAIPPSFPPFLFAAIAYGGADEDLVRDLIPTCDVCICAAEASEACAYPGRSPPAASAEACPVHAALELLRPFDAAVCTSLQNLLDKPIDTSSGLKVADVLGDAPAQPPSPEMVGYQLELAFQKDLPIGEQSDDDDIDADRIDSDGSDGGEVMCGEHGRGASVGDPAGANADATIAAAPSALAAPPGDASNFGEEPLTDANKARCVIRIVSFKLLESRLPEIVALRRGFHTIKWKSLVALFTGDELHELVCGVLSLEADELYNALGFDERTKSTRMPQWMKALIADKDVTWRKKLLRFITGSFTLPRGGLQRKIMVRSTAAHLDHLPRSSTCTFTLFMPPYKTYTELDNKLTMAIDNTAGFWLW